MEKKRYHLLDNLRGVTLVSMMLYHAMWDLVYMFGIEIRWYDSNVGYVWQQSICWTFIMLSGFCWSLGRRKLRRGLEVFGLSVIISLVTIFVMPDNLILFGVLSAIGTAMLVMIPLEKWFCKINPYIGLIFCIALFAITRNVNSGTLGFEGWELCTLPETWYRNLFTAYLGFPPEDFWSCDYFSVFPWIFLYQTGYFLYKIFEKKDLLQYLFGKKLPIVSWLGRNSLIVYALHQPVIYGVLTAVMWMLRG
ncbi:MAG: DUF1624 domain-containing protein [Lachnospiraceae bacterium]|nr:DUF1624 domain-containing protein [Lachnospiraceae bacterium]